VLPESPVKTKLLIAFAVCMILYTGSYLGFTKIYDGMFEGSCMRIRLFPNSFAAVLWTPLLQVEQSLRYGEFYGQVRSGASLPPAEPSQR